MWGVGSTDYKQRSRTNFDNLNTYLAEVEEILENRHLPELEAVVDGVAHDEGGHQVLHGPSLAAVRSEVEGVEAARLPEVVQDCDVGEHVVQVVRVRWVLAGGPLEKLL